MAKSADAADLKSAGRKRLWGFKSPSGHQRIRDTNASHLLYERCVYSGFHRQYEFSVQMRAPLTHEFQDSKALRHMEGLAHGGLPGKEFSRLSLTAKEVHAKPAAGMG
jgi:hypothetical protein